MFSEHKKMLDFIRAKNRNAQLHPDVSWERLWTKMLVGFLQVIDGS